MQARTSILTDDAARAGVAFRGLLGVPTLRNCIRMSPPAVLNQTGAMVTF